ncbi:amidohydrolase family protein [Hortaea werneckii]|nr:amidohydrolase family protein [Hortaea werneckii]
MTTQGKIDVHHHVYPPVFTEALTRGGGDPSGWYVPDWTVEMDDAICGELGVSTAILSCTAPGPDIEKDIGDASALARSCNEYCAKLRNEQPQRFGFFASVPDLSHTKEALAEIAYALDELAADGVILLTSYGHSSPKYLGDPSFTPIWDALSARNAVVLVHPTHAVGSLKSVNNLPQPVFDYPHETGRTALDLIVSHTLSRHAKGCKIILSHSGGTLPYLIDRVAGLLPHSPASFNPGMSRDELLEQARAFYYDTAAASSPMHLKALFALLGNQGKSHVLFGSDFPNAPAESIKYYTRQLAQNVDFTAEDLVANALELFPRLK